ncbi:DUF1295-domain-containing protein [Rozella allomycis CSF55]|uniref:DUF1295-domain-containing protein n=1 Tax=Rozella allomycis (strain CSF55) TaxID=988480 RepID=A0A4P9YL67_ROZAC|nr:DUF1295-domain-containing protein [Rozella allomycis CSF55]
MVATAPIDQYYVLFTLIITTIMQISFFFVAYSMQFDKVTDFAGCTNFILNALVVFFIQQTYYPRQIMLTVLVLIWGVRLGSFLLARVLRRGKDDRFNEMRSNFIQFLGFWIFQIIWVWVVSLPVTLTNSYVIDTPINDLDIFGLLLWILGFVCEAVADNAKASHNSDPEKRKTLLKTGLWKYSRHPNYFGEILLWIGVFIISCSGHAVNNALGYFSISSPILTFLLLMFVSGVPLAEQSSNKKFSGSQEYIEYKQSTSPLIPFPTNVYAVLPSFVKTVFFFEYGMYWKNFNDDKN